MVSDFTIASRLLGVPSNDFRHHLLTLGTRAEEIGLMTVKITNKEDKRKLDIIEDAERIFAWPTRAEYGPKKGWNMRRESIWCEG